MLHVPGLIVTIVIVVLMERRKTSQAHRKILSIVLIAAQLDLMKLMMAFASAIKTVLHAQAFIVTTVIAVRVERRRTPPVF